MTYLEKYRACSSWQELAQQIADDVLLAKILGRGEKCLQLIKEAGEQVVTEKGWWEDDIKGEE